MKLFDFFLQWRRLVSGIYYKLSLLSLFLCVNAPFLHLSGGQVQAQVCRSLVVAQALADDVDCHVFPFREFGKGRVKKLRVSPDAFIQISLQLAYYRVMFKQACTHTLPKCMNCLLEEL